MYQWRKHKQAMLYDGQMDVAVVLQTFEWNKLKYEAPVIANKLLEIKGFNTFDEYLWFLEYGTLDGFTI